MEEKKKGRKKNLYTFYTLCMWVVLYKPGRKIICNNSHHIEPSHRFIWNCSYICCISHDSTIQIYRCREIRNTDDSPLFRYETFITSWLFWHEERETIFIMLNVPTSPTLDPTSWTGPAQSQISTNSFFKNHQILSPLLLGMTSFTPQSYFLSGVFIMTFVIVITSACESELYSMCVHLY